MLARHVMAKSALISTARTKRDVRKLSDTERIKFGLPEIGNAMRIAPLQNDKSRFCAIYSDTHERVHSSLGMLRTKIKSVEYSADGPTYFSAIWSDFIKHLDGNPWYPLAEYRCWVNKDGVIEEVELTITLHPKADVSCAV